jgi:hypothetical protein
MKDQGSEQESDVEEIERKEERLRRTEITDGEIWREGERD